MSESQLVLRCTGREVDDELQPVGPECGRVFARRGHVDDAEHVNRARAGGWAVGPDGAVACPTCRRPAPLRDLLLDDALPGL